MRALTESDVRASFVNATDEDLRLLELPHDFVLTEWDHVDFFAWTNPSSRRRGYIIVERAGEPVGIVVRGSDTSRIRSAMCNLCHTMQPGTQVVMMSALRAGEAGARGDAVGTYACADLSCHETVRLAAPLAPGEMRRAGIVDRRIDGTRERVERFVERVLEPVSVD